MTTWSFALAAIAAAYTSSPSLVVSAFHSHHNVPQQRQQTRIFWGTFADSLSAVPPTPEPETITTTTTTTTTTALPVTLSIEETKEQILITSSETTPPSPVVTTEEQSLLTLEEELVVQLNNMAEENFGKKNRIAYRTALHNIHDSKSRSQRRLDRSALEQKYAQEKISKIVAKLEEEKKRMEREIKIKTMETQQVVNEEVKVIMRNIQTEIDHEIMRESQVRSLMSFIESSITRIECDLSSEEVITEDMKQVRSKVKKGTIASQIDRVLQQKGHVAQTDRRLVLDLQDLLGELGEMLARTQYRTLSMGSTLARFDQGSISSAGVSTTRSTAWSDLEQTEKLLASALEEAEECEKTLLVVRDWVYEAVWSKSQVLNEPLPQSMEAVETKKKARLAKEQETMHHLRLLDALTNDQDSENHDHTSLTTTSSTSTSSSSSTMPDLEKASEGKIVGAFGIAAGKAALAGGRTAMLGIKTLFDSVVESQVGEKTSVVWKKSSGMITKGLADAVSSSSHQPKFDDDEKDAVVVDNLKDIIQSQVDKDTLRSTTDRESLEDAVAEIVDNVSSPPSTTRQAGNTAMETIQKIKKNKNMNEEENDSSGGDLTP